MPPRETIALDHFETVYATKADPWSYATSPYEAGKYAATLAALPLRRYRRGLDVGCSIGVLTRQLADRCQSLLAIEPVEAALEQAKERCADQGHVEFRLASVPDRWPGGRFDLILVSEVLDFLSPDDLGRVTQDVLGALEPGGDLVLVHWVGKKGAVSSGHESGDELARLAGDALEPMHASRNRDYRIDVFRRR